MVTTSEATSMMSVLTVVTGIIIGIVGFDIQKRKTEQAKKKTRYVFYIISSIIAAIWIFIIPLYAHSGEGYGYDAGYQFGSVFLVSAIAAGIYYWKKRSARKREEKKQKDNLDGSL